MTAIPPSNQIGALTTAVDNLARLLTLNGERFTGYGRQTQATLKDLGSKIMSLSNMVARSTQAFNRSDDIQRKSLAIGTNLSRITSANTEALKGLRGSFLENTKEIIDNYSVGLRVNSKGLLNLQNRMRETGQSTELARTVFADLALLTQFNTNSLDKAAKSTVDLSRAYGTTQEVLLNVLQSLKPELRLASLGNLTAEFTEFSNNLTGMFPGNKDAVTSIMQSMFGAKGVGLRAMLGITESEDALKRGDFQEFVNLIKKGGTGAERMIQGGELWQKQALLQSLGSEEALTAFINVAKTIDQRSISKLTTTQDEFANNFKTMNNEIQSFAERSTLAYYIKSLDLLDGIKWAVLAGGALGMAQAGAGLGRRLAGAAAGGAATGAVGGPWGAALGAAIGAGLIAYPLIRDYFSDSTPHAREMLQLQRVNTRATVEVNERAKAKDSSGGLTGVMEREVMRAINSRQGTGSAASEEEAKRANEMIELLQSIRHEIRKNGKDV